MGTAIDALGPVTEVELPEGKILYHDRGQGPPVVFVHGLLANADAWRSIVPELATRFRCLTPDWPLGSHESAMEDGTDFSLFGLADLVDRTVAAIGVDRVVLVGADTGGAICQAVAARHPDRVDRLILAPSAAFDNFLPPPLKALQVLGRRPGGLRLVAEALRIRPIQRRMLSFGAFDRGAVPTEVAEGYIGPLRRLPAVRHDLAALIRAVSKYFTRESAEGLRRFEKPVLMTWTRQGFFPLAHAERLAGHLPDGRVEVIGASRRLVDEDTPHEFVRLVDAFLQEATT